MSHHSGNSLVRLYGSADFTVVDFLQQLIAANFAFCQFENKLPEPGINNYVFSWRRFFIMNGIIWLQLVCLIQY
jgi:hypothetical protein